MEEETSVIAVTLQGYHGAQLPEPQRQLIHLPLIKSSQSFSLSLPSTSCLLLSSSFFILISFVVPFVLLYNFNSTVVTFPSTWSGSPPSSSPSLIPLDHPSFSSYYSAPKKSQSFPRQRTKNKNITHHVDSIRITRTVSVTAFLPHLRLHFC